MKSLHLQLRFLVPLLITLTVAALLALPLLDRMTLRWFSRDLSARGAMVAKTLSVAIADIEPTAQRERLRNLLERGVLDERLVGIALCAPDGVRVMSTKGFPDTLSCKEAELSAAQKDPRLELASGAVHIGVFPVSPQHPDAERLVLLHDLSLPDRRSLDTRRYMIIFITVLGLAVAGITMIVAQLSWRGWVSGMRAILRGEGLVRPLLNTGGFRGGPETAPPELQPLEVEIRQHIRELEDNLYREHGPLTPWDPERLRGLLRTQLRGDQVIVVSNREPYIHQRGPDGITVSRPASGLVTAVEPVMRACSGTWIAHGSGSADQDVVDAHDRVAVPPDTQEYVLRRIWLSEEEERGYYQGFANEGLWPLCHVAHVRPVFRESDWAQYRAVNQRFADAVVAEARSDDPVVLVQDYHFALLPAMVREKLPKATIITFWHIPWPNPESFGICPWRRELLQGMLGSTILGFHTRFHCKNFTETVDRYLEARIEHEHSTISYQGEPTLVQSYPISIAWPTDEERAGWESPADARAAVFDRLGLAPDTVLAVGVDRFDYTKGILERLHAVERLLEKYPQWQGRFVLVQVAAPTRSALEEYREFQDRIHRVTERINLRFGGAGYKPVLLLAEHHDHAALMTLYRAAHMCVVTSLHDGMNLVCKEFIAARDDDQGVLILSRFAGAARELPEALVINPYHVEETTDALHRAAMMPPQEQRERMASLRMTVREFNVYRWAGRMLTDAGQWRLRERITRRVQRRSRESGEEALTP